MSDSRPWGWPRSLSLETTCRAAPAFALRSFPPRNFLGYTNLQPLNDGRLTAPSENSMHAGRQWHFAPKASEGLRPCTRKPRASGVAFAVALDNAAALIPLLTWSPAMRTSQLRLKLPLAESALAGGDLPATPT